MPRSTTTCVLSISHAGCGAAEVTQRLGEKYLAVETLKGRGSTGRTASASSTAPPMRSAPCASCRPVRPHAERCRAEVSSPGCKIVAARRHWRRLADAVPPAERRQCLIRQLRPAGHQFLMDSHEIPLAVAEKLQDALPVRFGLLGPAQFRDWAVAFDRSTLRTVGREIPSTRAISRLLDSLRVQFQDRGPLRLAQHAVSCSVKSSIRLCDRVAFECARSAAARLSHCLASNSWHRRAGQSAMRAVHNRHHHLQIAQQLRTLVPAGAFRLRLPLRFEKQLGDIEDAFADRGRAFAPSGIQLAGLPRYRSDAGRRSRPSAGSPPGYGGPPAPETSSPPARRILPSRTCCWIASGKSSTSASRRDTQLTLRSNRRANSSSP